MPFDPTMIEGGGYVPSVDSSVSGYEGNLPPGYQRNMAQNSNPGGAGLDPSGMVSSGMGLVQMAVGLAQLRRAKRLPFPNYRSTKGPYAEMKSIYESQYRQGIGSEQRGMMQSREAQTQAQKMNAIQNVSPQASAVFGRTAALDRTSGQSRIAQADIGARTQAMSGIERMNNAMTTILQKDISAARDYRIQAEQAAGLAIKRGSENLAAAASPSKKSN